MNAEGACGEEESGLGLRERKGCLVSPANHSRAFAMCSPVHSLHLDEEYGSLVGGEPYGGRSYGRKTARCVSAYLPLEINDTDGDTSVDRLGAWIYTSPLRPLTCANMALHVSYTSSNTIVDVYFARESAGIHPQWLSHIVFLIWVQSATVGV